MVAMSVLDVGKDAPLIGDCWMMIETWKVNSGLIGVMAIPGLS